MWELARASFSRTLRVVDPKLWDQLGRPRGVIPRLVVHEGWAVEGFVFRQDYKKLKSRRLQGKARYLFYVQLFGMAAMIHAVIALAYYWVAHW